MTDILTLARENGFSHIGFADMAALTPLEEVRKCALPTAADSGTQTGRVRRPAAA